MLPILNCISVWERLMLETKTADKKKTVTKKVYQVLGVVP